MLEHAGPVVNPNGVRSTMNTSTTHTTSTEEHNDPAFYGRIAGEELDEAILALQEQIAVAEASQVRAEDLERIARLLGWSRLNIKTAIRLMGPESSATIAGGAS